MAYVDLSKRKAGQNVFSPNMSPRPNAYLMGGLEGPSRYGIEGLTEFKTQLAEQQRLQEEAKRNELGRVQVPLNPDDFTSPLVYPGDAVRNAYQISKEGIEAGLAGENIKSQTARDVAGTQLAGTQFAAEKGYASATDVAKTKAEADKYAADARVKAAQIAAQAKIQELLSKRDASGGLTDEAIAGLADFVKITGTIPPLGMGAAAARDRQRIFNAAFGSGKFDIPPIYTQGGAQPSPEGPTPPPTGTTAPPPFTGTDMAFNKADYSASLAALKKFEGQRNLALSFENTANLNADLALEMSNKVDRSGSPVLNRLLLKVRGEYMGDEDVATLDAAIKTFANEYAKVTTGQTGGAAVSDSARQEIDRLINAAQTPGQFEAVVRLMQREMRNRAKGYEEQYQALKANMPTAGGNAPLPNDPLGLR